VATEPQDRVVAYAPQPGVTRTMTIGGAAVCFAWQMKAPDAGAFEAAMRSDLPAGATVAVLEISEFAIPVKGEPKFPWSGLHATSDTQPALWRGYIEYAPNAKFPVWARVDVRVPQTRVTAVSDIDSGIAVTADMIRTETVMASPGAVRNAAADPATVIGRVARRPIHANTPVSELVLNKRVDIQKGDPIRVKIRSGSSTIGFDATALASAAVGDSVSVKISDSGKTLRAMASAPGEATVVLPALAGGIKN
jgi:flagella basal body P-ring formation protein FlgA